MATFDVMCGPTYELKYLHVVTVPYSTKFDAEKIKQQLGISVRVWDERMYEMKQPSQRKVTQQEAVAYF